MVQIKFKQGTKLLQTIEGREVDTRGIIIQKTIPRLLPREMDYELLKTNADTIYEAIQVILIIHLMFMPIL